jgi:hypothetical protein
VKPCESLRAGEQPATSAVEGLATTNEEPPMAEVLNTVQCIARIDTIVREASKLLVIASPYLDPPAQILSALESAGLRGVRTVVLYRQTNAKEAALKKLAAVKGVELLDAPDLHAKCYINQKEALITSLNLYDWSAQNNFEMGVVVPFPTPEYKVALELLAEHMKLVRSRGSQPAAPAQLLSPLASPLAAPGLGLAAIAKSAPRRPTQAAPSPRTAPVPRARVASTAAATTGFCMRCRASVARNPEKPLCTTCYREWAIYSNPAYVEKFCHGCGKPHASSMSKPLCRGCYAKG